MVSVYAVGNIDRKICAVRHFSRIDECANQGDEAAARTEELLLSVRWHPLLRHLRTLVDAGRWAVLARLERASHCEQQLIAVLRRVTALQSMHRHLQLGYTYTLRKAAQLLTSSFMDAASKPANRI